MIWGMLIGLIIFGYINYQKYKRDTVNLAKEKKQADDNNIDREKSN